MRTSLPSERRRLIVWSATLIGLAAVASVLAVTTDVFGRGTSETIRIATTTSLDDSGLLDEILPDFEERYAVKTDVIAVGTGQALGLGERGDVDIVLVHAPELEQQFIDDGYGVDRTTVMRNPFIIVGADYDPAHVRGASDASDAFTRIANEGAAFVSRGDDSGTHFQELAIWEAASIHPESDLTWYHAAGQGMGETLLTAHELEAYVLTDRATFVAMGDRMSDFVPLFGAPGEPGDGDPLLDNPYSVIAVNPDRHPETNIELARDFIDWMNSDETRQRIARHGIDTYGEPLFTLIEDR